MDGMAGSKSSLTWAVHISVALLVAIWVFPTLGLLVSSFRTGEQITASGWWASFQAAEQTAQFRAEDPDGVRVADGDGFVVTGDLYAEGDPVDIVSWGTSSRDIGAYQPGDVADLGDGESFQVLEDGSYVWSGNDDQISGRGQRFFVTAETPPDFTFDNYELVLTTSTNDGMAKAFFNTLTVTIPATIIPILVAAFAAYALAWMDFPGRALLVAAVVALLVVPLQLALIPLLKLHNDIGIGKGYLGVWLAHTGFGMPLAIYLLRNYMVGLPRDIIESAKVDGATDFQIFIKIILPLSFPALASFAIFQFLWTWNDLLVALVFLIDSSGETTVMTRPDRGASGDARGGDWEILATAAFVSIAVPLLVFFSMQRYLVRGLLAGSVK